MPVPTTMRVAIGSRSTRASPAPWRPARPLPDSLRYSAANFFRRDSLELREFSREESQPGAPSFP